jgi:hypothetical protein
MKTDSWRSFAVVLVALLFGAGIGAWVATAMNSPTETVVKPIELDGGSSRPEGRSHDRRSKDRDRPKEKKHKKDKKGENAEDETPRETGGGDHEAPGPAPAPADDADPAPAPDPAPAGGDDEDDGADDSGDD